MKIITEREKLIRDIKEFTHKSLYYTPMDELMATMSSFYVETKRLAPELYSKKEHMMSKEYQEILDALRPLEGIYLPKFYITEIENSFNDYSNIVEEVIYKSLMRLMERQSIIPNVTLEKLDFTNKCQLCAKIVLEVCEYYGIPCKAVRLDQAYSPEARLLDGCGYHYFNIITIGDEEYLIDLSYKQFFLIRGCNKDRIGVPGIVSCFPGYFMMQDEERKKVATELLNKGYVKCTSDNLKLYLDGFTMSYHNGVYYSTHSLDDIGDYDFTDYQNFLKGTDDMLHHESKRNFGRVRKPIDYK